MIIKMRLEDLKQDSPKMPKEIRTMIEKEVQDQLKISSNKPKKHGIKKSVIVILAATMLLGTTALAGILYQMHNESVGTYAVRTTIEETTKNSSTTTSPIQISDVQMELSYLPEGMIQTEEGKYSYQNSLYKGGISIVFYKMDTGDAQFDMLTTNVATSEAIQIGNHDGIYIELQNHDSDAISFNQLIYIAYTDVHYVMQMYVASDVTKEDALKIAEGIRLQPVTDKTDANIVKSYIWSEYLTSQNNNENATFSEDSATVPKSALNNTHAIGEAFVAGQAEDGLENLTIKVTDVQLYDTISPLDLSVMDADFREEISKETDSSGNLKEATINYIKFGDGIHSIDEVVDSRTVPQKLVYTTLEYTNVGDEELSEILFFANLMKIVEKDGQMKLYDGNLSDTEPMWDEAIPTGSAYYVEMWYYDIHSGERNNNYINHLQPGETATIHMAWLVPEEELGYLYLNLDTYGSPYSFDEHSLAIGYVDIRQ